MLIEIKVPQLSESVAEAPCWVAQEGRRGVKRDENLIDIETDKVVLELPAPADGVLANIIKGDGSTVKADEVIATLDTEGKASGGRSRRGAGASEGAPAPAPAAKPAPSSAAPPCRRRESSPKRRASTPVRSREAAAAAASRKAMCSGQRARLRRRPPAAVKPSLPSRPLR